MEMLLDRFFLGAPLGFHPEDFTSLNNPGIRGLPISSSLLQGAPAMGSASPKHLPGMTLPWNLGSEERRAGGMLKSSPKQIFPPIFPLAEVAVVTDLALHNFFFFCLLINCHLMVFFKSFFLDWVCPIPQRDGQEGFSDPPSTFPGILGSLLSSWGFLLSSPTWAHPKAPFGWRERFKSQKSLSVLRK